MSEYLWSPPQHAEARFIPSGRRLIIAFIETPAAANAGVYLQ